MRSLRPQVLTALFFTLLALIGLWVSGDYGIPFDEPSEQVILKENLKEYAVHFFGEGSEAVRYYDHQNVNRISQSIERDHGESAYYLFAPLLKSTSAAPERLSPLWHAYTWLWFMAGVLALYGFSREMGFSRPVACFTALFLYLSPRFFAEGHYNNKDMILLSLTLLTLFLGLRLLKKPCHLRAVLFSLAGAMATNTKIVGLMPWGLVGLCIVLRLTVQKKWSLSMLAVALSAVLSFALFYALLTPALWPDPAGYFSHVLTNASGFSRWTGVIIYRGMVVNQKRGPIPRLYLPTMMGVTLPLYTLLLAGLGQCRGLWALLRSFREKRLAALGEVRTLMLLTITLCWLLPLSYAIIARPIVYNGWRHFYFVFAGIAPLAGYGVAGLSGWLTLGLDKCSGKASNAFFRRLLSLARPLAAALLCLLFAISAIGIIANHPYQYGYYNLLARTAAATDMELDYWALSSTNAVKKLVSTKERNQQLPLRLGALEEMSLLSLTNGHSALGQEIRDQLTLTEAKDAPYLLSNTTYALIYSVPPPEGYHRLFTIHSYGNILCTLYEQD